MEIFGVKTVNGLQKAFLKLPTAKTPRLIGVRSAGEAEKVM